MRQIPVDAAASEAGAEDTPSTRVVGAIEPTSDLLDRALVGWERFLDTFERSVR